MILLRNQLRRFYHFVPPTLSKLSSLAELEKVIHQRLIRNIKEVNESRLQPFNIISNLTKKLMLSNEMAADVKIRNLPVSIINPQTLQHNIFETRLDKDIRKIIKGVEPGFPFRSNDEEFHHFTETRGISTFEQLNQYKFDNKTLFVYNLPENISKEDIEVTLKNNKVLVQIKYCVLGLPAYAKVTYENAQQLKESLALIPQKKIQFGDRIAVIKSSQEQQKMKLGHRRLVLQIPPTARIEEYLLQFSRYGRVMHLDWPLEITLIPDVQDVKQFFKDSSQLIKINQIYTDGNVQSQYYPPMRVWDLDEDERSVDDFVDRSERLKEVYDHRSRFARNIDIHVGRQGQTVLKNRGYCVVTFSTYEQGQNYYFSHSSLAKIELAGERLDFEWDPTFRRELLRQIDNEYLFGKKKDFEREQQHYKKYLDPLSEDPSDYSLSKLRKNRNQYREQQQLPEQHYNLQYRIFKRIYFTEASEKNKNTKKFIFKKLLSQNQLRDWQDYIKKFKDAKSQLNSKSFDELAEIELYGRVLPKDENLERLIAQDMTHREAIENVMIEQHNLLTKKNDLLNRDKFYERQMERRNRLADKALSLQVEEQKNEEGEEEEQIQEQANDPKPGKHHFSTFKSFPLYRKRTAEQEAHYQHRYHEYVRSVIYEYMGVFHDKLIEEASHHKSDFLNSDNLRFSDGSAYIRQDDVTNILQFRRDFKRAQIDYEDYIYGNQYMKSSGINIEYLNTNFKKLYPQGMQYLHDVGLVEEIKEIIGDNLQEKIKILNAQIAEFGEEYQLRREENKNYLIKLRKYQNIYPMTKIQNIQNFIKQHAENVPPKQAFLFNKHFDKIRQTGHIPKQVLDAFKLPEDITVDDLLAQVGVKYNISRKDLQLSQKLINLSPEALEQDINEQLMMERQRQRKDKLNSDSFAKDPSEIYVKDREGYFRVSRYRQI